jgi:ABC-type proline/glycine betaine transport system ATPase subunit
MKRLTSGSDEGNICLIAVMGVTGSGKSNFIRHLTGSTGANGPIVGHELTSCEISYRLEELKALSFMSLTV